MVKEGWEQAPQNLPQDVFSYRLALCNQTASFRKLAQGNLGAGQEDMKCWYDQDTTWVELQPGQKVWVMEPVGPRALQVRWFGHMRWLRRRGRSPTWWTSVKTPRTPLRVLHVNSLKPHFERS